MRTLIKRMLDVRQLKGLSMPFAKLREYDDASFITRLSEFIESEAKKRSLDDGARHYLLYRIQRLLVPEFVIADHGRVILEDQAFKQVFRRFSDENWTSFERKWNLKEFLRLTKNVVGDFVECGVYRGGSAYLMCQFAAVSNREVHLFDSFDGLSKPDETEGGHWTEGDLSVSETEVRENLYEFECFKTFKGWIPERFSEVSEKKYSFLHVDVDLEQPTRDSIVFFYPRMDQGAIILLDDHGSAMCPGARRVALEYFRDHGETVLDLATGQGLVIKGR